MDRLYFDYNATTPVAPAVLEAFADALASWPGNPSSTHREGQLARQQLESARTRVAQRLGVHASELVFTSGGTESNNLAIFGVVRRHLESGAHVVTTAVEHPAVLEPCRRLEREGAAVTYVAPDRDGRVPASAIAEALRPDTALVSVMHANNEVGTIQPIAEIAAVVARHRRAGGHAYLHVDGSQAWGKIAVNVAGLGADLYTVSAHKHCGPKGVGALVVRKGVPVESVLFGGRHERDRRPGTENVAGAVALACAAELPEVALRPLRDRFERGMMDALDGLSVNGGGAERLPNTSNLRFSGVSGESLVIALDLLGCAVSTGAACSSGALTPSHVLLAMGQQESEARGAVRFSFGRFNAAQQVDRLIEATVAAVSRIRGAAAHRRPAPAVQYA